jgi:hypothetical protein
MMLQLLGVQVGALGLAVDVPGSLMAGQAFEVIAGPRETPLAVAALQRWARSVPARAATALFVAEPLRALRRSS